MTYWEFVRGTNEIENTNTFYRLTFKTLKSKRFNMSGGQNLTSREVGVL